MDNIAISNLSKDEWQKVRHKYYKSNSGMNRSTGAKILSEFDDILEDENIPYYLSCGTVLGFYRDGDFIPWDDEIDIDIMSEVMMPKFELLKEIFVKNGFIVRDTYRGKNSKMGIFKEGIKIAMASLSLENEYRIFSNQKIPCKLYENVYKFEYNKKEFNMPSPPEEYLTWYYGDWKTTVKSYDPNSYVSKKVWR